MHVIQKCNISFCTNKYEFPVRPDQLLTVLTFTSITWQCDCKAELKVKNGNLHVAHTYEWTEKEIRFLNGYGNLVCLQDQYLEWVWEVRVLWFQFFSSQFTRPPSYIRTSAARCIKLKNTCGSLPLIKTKVQLTHSLAVKLNNNNNIYCMSQAEV